MTLPALNRVRRLRFSLRALCLLVVVLGIALGWIGTQLRWVHQRREALQWIAPLRARQIAASRGAAPPPTKGYYVQRAGIKAPWSLAIFAESGVERIEVEQQWLDSNARYSVAELRSLFPEADIVVRERSDVR